MSYSNCLLNNLLNHSLEALGGDPGINPSCSQFPLNPSLNLNWIKIYDFLKKIWKKSKNLF